MMVIEAVGGGGKSALAWHWMKNRARTNTCHLTILMAAEKSMSGGAFVTTAQGVVTHLPFNSAGIASVAAGGDTLLEDLRQHRVMKRFAVPRGK